MLTRRLTNLDSGCVGSPISPSGAPITNKTTSLTSQILQRRQQINEYYKNNSKHPTKTKLNNDSEQSTKTPEPVKTAPEVPKSTPRIRLSMSARRARNVTVAFAGTPVQPVVHEPECHAVWQEIKTLTRKLARMPIINISREEISDHLASVEMIMRKTPGRQHSDGDY